MPDNSPSALAYLGQAAVWAGVAAGAAYVTTTTGDVALGATAFVAAGYSLAKVCHRLGDAAYTAVGGVGLVPGRF